MPNKQVRKHNGIIASLKPFFSPPINAGKKVFHVNGEQFWIVDDKGNWVIDPLFSFSRVKSQFWIVLCHLAQTLLAMETT